MTSNIPSVSLVHTYTAFIDYGPTATTTTLPAEDGTALYGNGAVVICDKVAGMVFS